LSIFNKSFKTVVPNVRCTPHKGALSLIDKLWRFAKFLCTAKSAFVTRQRLRG